MKVMEFDGRAEMRPAILFHSGSRQIGPIKVRGAEIGLDTFFHSGGWQIEPIKVRGGASVIHIFKHFLSHLDVPFLLLRRHLCHQLRPLAHHGVQVALPTNRHSQI